jgi:hypothetical protein
MAAERQTALAIIISRNFFSFILGLPAPPMGD